MKEQPTVGPALQVWVAQLADPPCCTAAETLPAQLPEQLARRIARFQHGQDRALRLGGLTLLAHALRVLAGVKPAQSYAALHYDTHGRPFLATALLHSPWQVSFSYASPWVACALRGGPPASVASHADGIGIDIELTDIASPLYAGPTAPFAHIFSPAEQEALAHAADSGSARVQQWTAKEAVFKAVGSGFSANPQHMATCVQPATASTRVSVHSGLSTISPYCRPQEPVYALLHGPQRVFYQNISFVHGWLGIAACTPWQDVQISFLRLGQKGHTLLAI